MNRTKRTVEYWAERGVPEARFVLAVREARAQGAPQYGERFRNWLRSCGQTEIEIDSAIARLETVKA